MYQARYRVLRQNARLAALWTRIVVAAVNILGLFAGIVGAVGIVVGSVGGGRVRIGDGVREVG